MYKFFKKNNLQILRFIISGVVASLANYLVYVSCYLAIKNIVLASISGYLIGLLVSFVFAKIWVFKNRLKEPIIKSFPLFCLIYFLGGIEMFCIIVFLNQLIDNYRIAWLFGAIVGASNNYLGSKYILFKE